VLVAATGSLRVAVVPVAGQVAQDCIVSAVDYTVSAVDYIDFPVAHMGYLLCPSNRFSC
jgi:hypothetical protein